MARWRTLKLPSAYSFRMDTTFHLLPSNSHCPKPGCGRLLPVKFKQGGINDRKAYLLCINPTVHSDKYWVHEERSPPLTQGGHAPAKPKGCQSAFCVIKTVKAVCPNHMCKSHCISTGGCFSHGFPPNPQLLPCQRRHPRICCFRPSQTLPSAYPPSVSGAESYDILDDFLSRTAPADTTSWDAYYYLSDVDHDEQDLQAALAQSVADLQPLHPPPPPPPPSPPPPPPAQAQTTTSKPKKGKIRAAPGTKKAHEQRLKGRFLVNYWDQNGADPVSVTVYKRSTVCSLAEHLDTLQALSTDLGPVDYYDLKLRCWIQDDLNCPLEVTPRPRRPGRHCYRGSTDDGSDIDIDDGAPSLATSPDWRLSVPSPASSFTPSQLLPDDSDLDFGSSITSLVQRKRFHYHNSDNEDSDCPSPSKAPRLAFSSNEAQCTLSRVPSAASVGRPNKCVSTSTRWPTFMYTIDMSEGLQQIESPEMKEQYRRLEDRFQVVFGVPFAASTYHDAKKRWLRASEEGLLEDAEAAGHTDAGHWSKLAAQVPLK
ncbi:hypothetical protein DFJ58DRAFT_846093 [Suillus subalutaceus]|uniref:uncharacterized protein n=1 Tax=Suillus subalutaceus TaxID=48586 RepID=UPI001B87B91D|nr:uncharacterized protein DFJ58DRAFT_846093 [Suillus subalutaceus]KAG1838379.1 hypothetical protein DFJ58DRAFT_846093 [Suillus subalutaceus]